MFLSVAAGSGGVNGGNNLLEVGQCYGCYLKGMSTPVYFVSEKACGDRFRSTVIEQNPHQATSADFPRLSLAKWITACTSSSVTSKTSVISRTDMPASILSNTVCTGIRVPLKTHAPPSLPGTLSTALHFDQSRAPIKADVTAKRRKRQS